MPEVRIVAEPRTEFGKGAARRARRAGRVPAILYGHGTDTRHITLPGHQLLMALKTPNVLIEVDGLSGRPQLTLPKAVQRDPIRGGIEHVDLIMVRRGEKVTVEIPVQVTGEVEPGGLLDQQMVRLAVEAEATQIPQAIEVDVEGMEIGLCRARGGPGPAAAASRWRPSPRLSCCMCWRRRPPSRSRPSLARPRPRKRWRPRRMRCRTLPNRRPKSPPADPSGPLMTGDRWLIAGLGNPGPAYAANRHNAGFLTADVLAARAGARFKAGKFRTLAAEGKLAGQSVTIIKPLTFMNESGGPVTGVSGFYRLGPEQLVVIHDELDLPFGTVRLKLGGGDNGHNGLRSVTARLGTREYYRVRIGIGRPAGPDGPGRVRAARLRRGGAEGTAARARPGGGCGGGAARRRPRRRAERLPWRRRAPDELRRMMLWSTLVPVAESGRRRAHRRERFRA